MWTCLRGGLMFRKRRKRYEYTFFMAQDTVVENELSLNNMGSQGWRFVALYRLKQPNSNERANSTLMMERESRW